MRKSISYKRGQSLIRAWTLRLALGAAGSYAASIAVMFLFRHFGSEPMLIVGFLCVFALMPGVVLVIFSFPTTRKLDRRGRGTASIRPLAVLAALLSSAGIH